MPASEEGYYDCIWMERKGNQGPNVRIDDITNRRKYFILAPTKEHPMRKEKSSARVVLENHWAATFPKLPIKHRTIELQS